MLVHRPAVSQHAQRTPAGYLGGGLAKPAHAVLPREHYDCPCLEQGLKSIQLTQAML